ncbi:MAG: hypothetical protein IT385_23140 [Deltaproteobacteria bacterium]|nr:hypothetical protein [Deltaproteobacteria bacterium]
MLSTTVERFERAWPPTGLVAPTEVLVEGVTERVVEGGSPTNGMRMIVSMRDLGAGAHAGRWATGLAKLLGVTSPALARLIGARIVDERYFVLRVRRPPGMTVHQRMARGPLDGTAALAVARTALRACEDLNAAGLSAAGLRLGSAMIDEPPEGPSVQLTTYGLFLDHTIDPVHELRELALRTLALVGATSHGLGSRIDVPKGALPPVVSELLCEAAGLVPDHPIDSAHELTLALRAATHAVH